MTGFVSIRQSRLAYTWLRQAIFAEETLTFKAGALEKRKAQASATLKQVCGDKPKGQIGEID